MAEESRRDFEAEVMSYFDNARKKNAAYNKNYNLDYILKQKEKKNKLYCSFF